MDTKTDTPIEVIIVDDHPMVRKGLASFLLSSRDLRLAGEAANGTEALALCRETQPDIILMDLVMPEMDGFAAIEKIRGFYPDVKIIALTSYPDARYIQRAVNAGVNGFLYKDISSEGLYHAIQSVLEGSQAFSAPVERMFHQHIDENRKIKKLTAREQEVFQMLLEGCTNPEIAGRLVLSRSTVKVHVSRILEKLGVANRIELLKTYAHL